MLGKTCTALLAAVLALGLHSAAADSCVGQWQKCGSDATKDPSCCPDSFYCQPWDAGYYQCIQVPDKCKKQLVNTDFYGNDIKKVSGIQPGDCCAECGKTQGCVAYTFVNSAPGSPACYLKSGMSDRRTKTGAVSGIMGDGPATVKPNAPDQCTTQYADTDLYGNDLKTVYGIENSECCSKCGDTTGCVAYTFVSGTSLSQNACYLKSSASGKTTKTGAVSGLLNNASPSPTPTTSKDATPAKCSTQYADTDLYGNDLKTVYGVENNECCNKCGDTTGCVAYTFVSGTSLSQNACYLKSSASGKKSKTGAISGVLNTVPQPPTPSNTSTASPPPSSCDTPKWGMCGSSSASVKCCPDGYYCQPWSAEYYQCIQLLKKCSTPLTDMDYAGNDLKTVYVSDPSLCCDKCAETSGCKAFTYINGGNGQPVCYLKSAAGTPKKVVGAIAGKLN